MYRHENPRVFRWAEDDPRGSFNGGMRRFARVLKDDAIRLWIEGDREAAIDRAEAIVRIGRHIASPGGRLIDALVSGAIQRLGLDLIERMGAAGPTDDDRDRLITICLLVPTVDPTSVKSVWASQYFAQREFVERQLEVDGGGDALWVQMGMILGVEQVLKQMFNPVLEALESDGEVEPLPDDWPNGSFSIAEAFRASEEQFGSLSYDDLVAAFETSCSYGDDIIERWDDEYSEYLFEAVDSFVDEDETLIGFIVLGPTGSIREENPKTLIKRNSAIATLCGADPAP